jgi:hypothetical protein
VNVLRLLLRRQGGWLADFAELGKRARGQLPQATSSISLLKTRL